MELSVPGVQEIANAPGSDVGVAVVEQLAEPLTSDVPSVSPFTNPESVAVNVGSTAPYARD